jgi:hypothetical protein
LPHAGLYSGIGDQGYNVLQQAYPLGVHAAALELNPQLGRQIVLVSLKILSNFVLGLSLWLGEHLGKDAAPH